EKEKEKERTIGVAMIPLSMMGRVGKCLDDPQRRMVSIPTKGQIERIKSLEFSSVYGSSMQKDRTVRNSLELVDGRPQPKELVRIIMNNDAVMEEVESNQKRGIDPVKERREGDGDERVEKEDEDEDEGGWLSTRLQEGMNGMRTERGEKRMVNPSAAAAFRLFDRAAASAVCSSTLKDAKPMMKEVRGSRDANDLFGEEKGGKGGKGGKQNKRRIQERIQIMPHNDRSGKAKRKHRNRSGDKGKVSQQSSIRLLECYY
ncbi:hypothetical protein PENTCL1PPCAC_18344, partial [Pristionchus entomophagus]